MTVRHKATIARLSAPCLVLLASVTLQAAPVSGTADRGHRVDISQLGAVGDSKSVNTVLIQKTIDRLAERGGGTVVVPEGVFVSGAVFFKPGVKLHLEKGAVLRASTDMKHFPEQRTRIEGHFEEKFNPALVNVDGCDGFRLSGEGTLDGAGRPIWDEFWKRRNAAEDRKNFRNLSVPRARLCIIENSKNIEVRGVTFRDSQFWNLHLYKNDGVLVEDARFEVPDNYKQVPSSDGIDIDSSRNVTIRGCHFSITDDCIAAKGSKGPFALEDKDSPPVENIRVSGCTFRRGHSMFTCGSEATVVRNVVIEDCEVKGSMPLLTLKLRPDTPQHYEDITIRDIRVDSGGAKLFSISKWTQYFDLKGQPEPQSYVGDITLSGIKGRIRTLGTIEGNKGTKFGRVTLEHVEVKSWDARLKKGGAVKDFEMKEVTVNGKRLD